MRDLEKKVYGVADIREYLGIGVQQAYQLCRQEGFPAIRLGPRRIVIPRAEFEAWLHEQATKQKGE